MTDQKSRKRRVRARMTKTGERYTAARSQLLARTTAEPPDAAEPAPASPPPPDAPATTFRDGQTSNETLVARTGRTWEAWFALLDASGARERPHAEIARWLNTEHGVDGWWAQEVTVGYEMAIGRRKPGERPDGFSVSASKTVAVPVERLFEAFVDETRRAAWLPDVELRIRTATAPKTARFDWEDGSSRVIAGFSAKDLDRSTVALAHERLPDAETAARMKAFWRERVQALKVQLERPSTG